MSNTFADWLLRQQHRNDAVGDLARDAAQDGCLPCDATATGVGHHIAHSHGGEITAVVLEVLAKAHAEWEAAS